MGNIQSEEDTCLKWSQNKNIDPVSGEELSIGDVQYKNYEVLCMHILNEKLPTSEETRERLLSNLQGTCYNQEDPITMDPFNEMDQDTINNIIMIGEGEKKHCFLLDTIYEHIRQSARPTNPFTREPMTHNDIERIKYAMKHKLHKLIKIWKVRLDSMVKTCDDVFIETHQRLKYPEFSEFAELAIEHRCDRIVQYLLTTMSVVDRNALLQKYINIDKPSLYGIKYLRPFANMKWLGQIYQKAKVQRNYKIITYAEEILCDTWESNNNKNPITNIDITSRDRIAYNRMCYDMRLKRDDIQMVKRVYEGKADSKQLEMILENAIGNNYFGIVMYLVSNGVKVKDMLSKAIRESALSMVDYFIRIGIKDDIALVASSEKGYLHLVKYFVEHGMDVNANMPIAGASENGHYEVVKYLVEHGADITTEDYQLMVAIKNGHIAIVEYLLTHGMDVRIYGEKALAEARKYNKQDIIDMIENI